MEKKSLQFNAMLFESYDKYIGEKSDENDHEDFLLPFNQDKEHENYGIYGYGYGSDNLNMYNLKNKRRAYN